MARCAACGRELAPRAARYAVRIEVYAPYEPLVIDEEELQRDRSGELQALARELEDLEPQEAQDGVHRSFQYLLCRPCQRAYLSDPLRPPFPSGPAG